MRCPYTLYKEKTKTGLGWYARFWDEKSRRYAISRSLGIAVEGKRERKREAEEKARQMVPAVQEELKAICSAQAELALAPSSKIGDIPLVQYVLNFWTPGSPYVQECAVIKKKPLSTRYVQSQYNAAKLHIATYPGFKNLTVGGLTAGLIRDWMRWCAERGLTGGLINKVMESIRGAVVDAFKRDEIGRNPFVHIAKAADIRRERGVLSKDEILKLIACPDKNTDPRSHLGILLGLLCGMRLGEVRGLLWGDIEWDNSLIHISHNFVDEDGLKSPKCESARSVPLPEPVKAAFLKVKKITDKTGSEDFAFPSLDRKGKPLGKGFFEKALKRELESIGIPGKWHGKAPAPDGYIDEQRRRNLPMHATRHTFVTHIRMAGISDIEVQALAGHRSGAMMAHYSHAKQVIDFNQTREKLEAAITTKQEAV